MSDFETPIEPTEVPANPETEETLDDFLGELDEFEQVAFDPAKIITLRTSAGDARYIPTDIPLTVRDVIEKAGIFPGVAVEYWLNGSKVQLDSVIGPGQTLAVVGSVKGG